MKKIFNKIRLVLLKWLHGIPKELEQKITVQEYLEKPETFYADFTVSGTSLKDRRKLYEVYRTNQPIDNIPNFDIYKDELQRQLASKAGDYINYKFEYNPLTDLYRIRALLKVVK